MGAHEPLGGLPPSGSARPCRCVRSRDRQFWRCPLSTSAHATHLRERADDLRRFAEQLEHTPAADVDRLAGDDTWRGRRPALCRFVLRINLAQLHAAADDLRWKAALLEQQADQLDAALGS